MSSSMKDAASPHGSAARFWRLRMLVVLFGALVLLAFAAASAYDVWRSYRHTVTSTNREISNVANALAEQTAWTWQAVDLLLLDTARWYRDNASQIPAGDLDSALARRAAGTQVRLVTIADANGIQRHRSQGSAPPDFDISDRDYFIAQRDRPDAGLYMSEPLASRSIGRNAVFFSRRIEDTRGQFSGVVTAIVALEDLQRFYSAINLGLGTSTYLLREDGMLLLRNPPVPDVVGRKFTTLASAESTPANGFSNPVDDGNPEFVAVARVRGTPLEVAVTRDRQLGLRPWHYESLSVAIRTAVLTLLGALTIVAVVRQLRHIEAGERALRAREEQLRQAQKMEAIGTLAGGIAHDFNNILGAILGYGELAHQQAPEGSTLRRYLDNVMHAGGRAKTLVDRILGFSRSGMGERVPVNVEFVVAETLELLEPSLPPGIQLQARLEAGDAAVIGDATRLHQVVMNLCTNAMQAMAQHGGTLNVTLRLVVLAEARTVSRGTLPPGDYVTLAIADTGAGIPPQVLERIFDPFFTTKAVGEGTGLGLSLVHGIVIDLGGGIDVISKPGEGTRFEIWLPVTGETRKPTLEAPQGLPQGQGQTVMVVDDEQTLVALNEELLAQLGYEPVGFESSAAALRAFQAQPQRFDVILTDEAMPDLTGTDLAREIHGLRPEVPIILVSGYGGPQLTARATANGVSAVLRKPLRGGELAETLARVLEFESA